MNYKMKEIETKVPILKKWRIDNYNFKKASFNEKKKRKIFVECEKYQTNQYPIMTSYKQISINKLHE